MMPRQHRSTGGTDAALDSQIALLREGHAEQEALCAALEEIADCLPSIPDVAQVLRVATAMSEMAQRALPHAEWLLAILPGDARPMPLVLEQVRRMHIADAAHGEEVVDALWRMARREPGPPADELGYMLRCFFDGCRRAIALKEALVTAWEDAHPPGETQALRR